MAFMLIVLFGMTAYAFGLLAWVTALLRGRWRGSWGWFAGSAVLLLPPAGLTYFVGVFAGGLDVAESCALSGHTYDGDYALAHRSDSFPVRPPCNAEHDLVADWVNPTLVVLVLASVGCAVAAAVIAFRAGRRNGRAGRLGDLSQADTVR